MIGDTRFTWLLTAFLWASTGYAQTVEPGTIVVVWGAVIGCEEWPDRILDLEVVPLEGAIELLGQEFYVQGLSNDEVLGQIKAKIKGETGREPTTLRLSNERRITRKLTQAYTISQTHLEALTCPIGRNSKEGPGLGGGIPLPIGVDRRDIQRGLKDWPGYHGDVPLPVKLELRNIVAHPPTPSKSDKRITGCTA